ncbi:SDR family oxidoreductase [uncultured Sunxiuqinia sp.]|uniref:SDR family oxidoreductase n=1 Tax=uncultured Sunxiuqinia sp. TaxID=1573825 RepID=UPI0030DA6EAD|tara:strand:+ start:3412 stop:4287 length:876 start_codon:yes stop_codon:yes gene_type:complete
MNELLITGATGKLGSQVLALLVEKMDVHNIAAIARDPAKLEAYQAKGVKVIQADYDQPASLDKAFEGIDTLYFVSASDIDKRREQHENVVNAAKKAGIRHVVYTSFQRKDETPGSPIAPVAQVHLQTEQWLKESGMTYTILKHALYSDVVPMFIGDQVLETGVVYQPAGDGKVSFASRTDMAEAGVNVLTSAGHENKTYEIAGSQSYSYADVAEMLSVIGGKPVHYVAPSVEEFTKAMKDAGVSDDMIELLVMFNLGIKQGEFDVPGDTLEKLLGRKPEDLSEFLKKVYAK